ncbi:MAG: hypothetical protein R3B93_10200 [Bacteroidia bacterium]
MLKSNCYLILTLMLLILRGEDSLELIEKNRTIHSDKELVFFKKEEFDIQIYEDLPENDSLPMYIDIPMDFLNQVRENNSRVMIRNGNLAKAEVLAKEYQLYLGKYRRLCTIHGLSQEIKKTDFFALRNDFPFDENQKLWKKIKIQRKELKKLNNLYQKHLRLTVSTENVIRRQKIHFPELTERMSKLCNFNLNMLPVYVFTYSRLSIPGQDNIVGISTIIEHEGLFTSDSPDFRQKYPRLNGKKWALSVHLKRGVSGKILSHELGHLYYLYHHWEEYKDYIEGQGQYYMMGGHGENDPSGAAAELAEKRILPK